jgi:hypothetical protein
MFAWSRHVIISSLMYRFQARAPEVLSLCQNTMFFGSIERKLINVRFGISLRVSSEENQPKL